jgi:hypothetical protein
LPLASFIRPAARPSSLADLALQGDKEQTTLFVFSPKIGETTGHY